MASMDGKVVVVTGAARGVGFGIAQEMAAAGARREIGKAAVFLSSNQSSFITGVELFADGGVAQSG